MSRDSTAEKRTAYRTRNAEIAQICMREKLAARIMGVVEENHWTQAEVGARLSVSQSRISDLKRARLEKFSIDKLVFWLHLLGQSVDIKIHSDGGVLIGKQIPTGAAESVRYFTQALVLSPGDGGLYQNRGDAFLSLQNYTQALEDYSRSIKLMPEAKGPRLQRIHAYRKCGDLKKALKDCEAYIKLFNEGYSTLALVFEQMGDDSRALEEYSKEIKKGADGPGVYWNRGNVYERLNRPKKALADYEKALEFNAQLSFISDAITRLKS